MFAQIKGWLAAPTFDDSEKTRVAGLLNTILVAVMGLMAAWIIITPFVSSNPIASSVSLGLVFLISAIALFLLRRGFVQKASLFFVSTGWLLITIVSYYFGGLQNPGFHSYILIVLIGGLLLGGRAAIIVAVLNVMIGWGFYFLESRQALPAAFILNNSQEVWLVFTVNSIIAAVLLYLAISNLEQSLERARHEITERKRAEEATQQLAEQRRQLLVASQTILSTLTLDKVVERIFQALGEALKYDACGLYWFDKPNQVLIPHVVLGADQQILEPFLDYSIPAGQGIMGAVIVSGQGEMVNNAHLDPRSIYPENAQIEKEHMICIPIQTPENRVGVLHVSRISGPPFTNDEFELVQLFVAQAAIAIENAQLYTQTQQRLKEQIALRKAGQVIAASLDIETVLHHIAEQMGQAVDATSVYISGVDMETDTLTILAEYYGPQAHALEQKSDRGYTYYIPKAFPDTQEILGSGNPGVSHHDDSGTAAPKLRHMKQYGAKSVLEIPMQVGGQIIALATIWESRRRREFTAEEISLCQSIAQQAAIAIENARLYNQAQQEITERKRAEQALRQSEQKYRTLIESMNEGLTQVDDKGILKFVNDRFCQITGYSINELIGQNVYTLLLQPEDKAFLEEKYRLRKQGISDQYELQMRKKSGEFIWVHTSASPITDATGEIVGTLGIHSDITERKHTEQIRVKLEEQLRQVQKMEAVGTLAGGIAHDFNNMLTAIMGYADLILTILPADHPAHNDAQTIKRLSERAAGLTRQLLTFARQQAIEPTELNLNNLILDLKERLQHILGHKIDMVTQLQPSLAQVKVDPYQIEQIMINLVTNAQEAMPNGGKLTLTTANVTISQTQQEQTAIPAGDYVLLCIEDSGIGIDDEVKPHIFEPFFTTKEVGRGPGLGLATAFGIIKQSNGHIQVESQPWQGTRISVYLPQIAATPNIDPPAADIPKPPLPGKETILLVEDDPSIRYLTSRMLSHEGYNVIEAANGNEALKLAQTHRNIDLVITDVIMPQMGGKTLVARLRAMQPELKVLFISGRADNHLSPDTLEEGIDFLQKPFTPATLTGKVEQMLGKSNPAFNED